MRAPTVFCSFILLNILLLHSTVTSSRRTNQRNGVGSGGPRKGTLPLPDQPNNNNNGGGGGTGTSSSASYPSLSSYYDSEESKYALWENNSRRKYPRKSASIGKEKKPNIILLLADDQDIELGSMSFMPKTLKILGVGGAHFPNAYVTTPMCCPSRSSLLTGLYVHNHDVYTNNDNCSSIQWQQEHEPHTFATYLNNAGYRTAFFGKYLNEYNGSYIPPGWREWAGLVRNSRFYNYTINVNGNRIKHGDNYLLDYYPDLIANDSIAFLRQSKQSFVNKPVMMVMSFPTPHGPEDSAPQYQHMFHNITTHRTPSWNYAPNPDKQWLLRHTQKMEPIHVKFTDVLHTKRLQTLQSIDETVGRLYQELVNLGELDNTYIIYTSDHGYHLGQFGLVKGKSMPFEFDVRVPFYVRGPKVPQGVQINKIVLNVDIAPTFLDIAGVEVPDHMDGKSFLPIIMDAYNQSLGGPGDSRKTRQWRDSFLIERGKVSREFGFTPIPFHNRLNNEDSLAQECQLLEYKSPCQPFQKWECFFDGDKWHKRRCHGSVRRGKNNCVCSYPPYGNSDSETDEDDDEQQQQYADFKAAMKRGQDDQDLNFAYGKRKIRMDPVERRLQRRFLKNHLGKDFKPVFLGARVKRDIVDKDNIDEDELGAKDSEEYQDLQDEEWDVNDNPLLNDDNQDSSNEQSEHTIAVRSIAFKNNGAVMVAGCVIYANSTITCPEGVYKDPRLWREKKEKLDMTIKKFQNKLGELKGVRKHLKRKRPNAFFSNGLTDEDPVVPNKNTHCACDFEDTNDFGYQQRVEQRNRLREERQRVKEEKMKKRERKLRRKAKLEHTACNIEKMNCFSHNNDHWKTPPRWTSGPFCFCQNSNNNTYWCARTINETHNFLYCEFITGFQSYYNLRVDPYQLKNVFNELNEDTRADLKKLLNRLRSCKGSRDCSIRYKPEGKENKHRLGRDYGILTTKPHNFRHWHRRRRWHNEERKRANNDRRNG